MKPLSPEMQAAVRKALRQTEHAVHRAAALLNHPEGHPPERLEDVLNEVHDAGYRARRAYRPEGMQ